MAENFIQIPEISDYSKLLDEGILLGNFQTSSSNAAYVAAATGSIIYIGALSDPSGYTYIYLLTHNANQRAYANKGDNTGATGFIVSNVHGTIYYRSKGWYTSAGDDSVIGGNKLNPYDTENNLFIAFGDYSPEPESYSITYRLTNCTAPSAPVEASVGDTVNVPLVMQQGYDIVTPSADIVVTNNGVTVPHTYTNGTISFTMPDPS